MVSLLRRAACQPLLFWAPSPTPPPSSMGNKNTPTHPPTHTLRTPLCVRACEHSALLAAALKANELSLADDVFVQVRAHTARVADAGVCVEGIKGGAFTPHSCHMVHCSRGLHLFA